MKQTIVSINMTLIVKSYDNIDVKEVITNMESGFVSNTKGATIMNSQLNNVDIINERM